MIFKNFLISHFPFLGKYKRLSIALINALLPTKKSYSQNNEDQIIFELLKDYPIPEIGYIDVGSNHPTDISNTYLLYRSGNCGYLVEPNKELCELSKLIRRKDKILNIGLGLNAGVLPFYVSRTPIGSSFDKQHFSTLSQKIHRIEYIPVLTLDSAFCQFEIQTIGLLSIDVEGWNFDVLQSAKRTIEKVFVLCVEYDSLEDRKKILDFLVNFILVHDGGCNLIFKKKGFA